MKKRVTGLGGRSGGVMNMEINAQHSGAPFSRIPPIFLQARSSS